MAIVTLDTDDVFTKLFGTQSLLSDAAVGELRAGGIVDGVGDDLLDLLGKTLLKCLRNDTLPSGVGDLAGLRVGAGVVGGVWDLVLYRGWDLGNVSGGKSSNGIKTCLLLDALGELGIGGVRNALSLFVLHIDEFGGGVVRLCEGKIAMRWIGIEKGLRSGTARIYTTSHTATGQSLDAPVADIGDEMHRLLQSDIMTLEAMRRMRRSSSCVPGCGAFDLPFGRQCGYTPLPL